MNERLIELGLLTEFEAAVRNSDRQRVVAVLTQLAFSKNEARSWAKEHLPKRTKSADKTE